MNMPIKWEVSPNLFILLLVFCEFTSASLVFGYQPSELTRGACIPQIGAVSGKCTLGMMINYSTDWSAYLPLFATLNTVNSVGQQNQERII